MEYEQIFQSLADQSESATVARGARPALENSGIPEDTFSFKRYL
jgi:hypothetical protein